MYERFVEIQKDQYACADQEVVAMIPLIAKNNLLCHLIDTSKVQHLEEMKRIITEFAEKIDIINMNNIPMQKTIELLKNKNSLQQKVVDFIKNADLYMDNFEYVGKERINFEVDEDGKELEEKVLELPEMVMEQIRLVSIYKGVHVPSVVFDSTYGL